MNRFRLFFSMLIVAIPGISHGATEIGEYCFSGAFYKDGNCMIRLEFTEHTKNFSINGRIACANDANDDGISGIASGSGYIDGNTFRGALTIPHAWGQIGQAFGEIEPHGMTFEVNLSNMTSVFRKKTASADVCGPNFLPICIEESQFSVVGCN